MLFTVKLHGEIITSEIPKADDFIDYIYSFVQQYIERAA